MITALAVMAGIFGASGQQRTIIAGLEGNTEYRTLMEEERGLVRIADSLAAEISSLRRLLRTDTLGRAANSAAIVRMEERGFEIRSRMARLASRINIIEQEWILQSLTAGPTEDAIARNDVTAPEEAAPGYHARNLVYSSYFGDALSHEQLAELHGAQEAESELPQLLEQYRRDRGSLEALVGEYGRAGTQAEADSLGRLFRELSMAGEETRRRIGEVWGAIFDSKSYLYNLMADKQNRRDLLDRFELGMERVREERSRHAEAPAEIADHLLQKRMLTVYEMELAEELGNRSAADSLREAAARIPGPESLADLAPVTLKERLFLDYGDILVGGSPYNSSNPIPEVAVWPKGVIWRVHIGNFSARQSPQIFRGVHPIAVQIGDDRRFRYFAGGFPTDSLAAKAVERLRGAGFRAPSAVVWMDGVYIDPAAGNERIYRVEISGIGELPPGIRQIIASATGEDEDAPEEQAHDALRGAKAEIVRAPGLFIVTPLDGASAVRLRTGLEALKAEHPEMEIRLSENPE